MAMAVRDARFLGADLSTTALSVGVRSEAGEEDFVSVPVAGQTTWQQQPGFDLEYLPQMILSALEKFAFRDWKFGIPGSLSFSVRQHDMVLMDADRMPLIPAISWECHVAEAEVLELEELGVDRIVGPIAPRFILPKLIWALRQDPGLVTRLAAVAATGDYVGAMLTGNLRLSASDALSNALLVQSTKQLAREAIDNTFASANWFPEVIPSGAVVGQVLPPGDRASSWHQVCKLLQGWTVGSSLGDNHASAVGCGLADEQTIVISGGSSGTVVRVCQPASKLAGKANCFEFYDDRLLLMMLPDCAIWYARFLQRNEQLPTEHDILNQSVLDSDFSQICRVRQEASQGNWTEIYPPGFDDLPWPSQVASTQFSIALELVKLVQEMLMEVQDVEWGSTRVVLTGGLCQSPFIRAVLQSGLKQLAPSVSVCVSARSDRLAFQSATYGALINSMLLGDYAHLRETSERLCPQRDCETLPADQAAILQVLIGQHLSGSTVE
ncbi:MAG: hypothetical protein CMJ81_02575 [Planctomycetaceae bacterium]|nr:hypothetical protein [Planctomycetaceae bacterium]MBP61596.1 hypothetical protein [Planctomycetaceae bacterium]